MNNEHTDLKWYSTNFQVYCRTQATESPSKTSTNRKLGELSQMLKSQWSTYPMLSKLNFLIAPRNSTDLEQIQASEGWGITLNLP